MPFWNIPEIKTKAIGVQFPDYQKMELSNLYLSQDLYSKFQTTDSLQSQIPKTIHIYSFSQVNQLITSTCSEGDDPSSLFL